MSPKGEQTKRCHNSNKNAKKTTLAQYCNSQKIQLQGASMKPIFQLVYPRIFRTKISILLNSVQEMLISKKQDQCQSFKHDYQQSMATFTKDQPQYILIKKGYNLIDKEGVKTLCENKWPELQQLLLDHNMIEGDSIVHFKRAPWKKLVILQLGNNQLQKGVTAFHLLDWKYIAELNLQANQLKLENMSEICKTDWKSLSIINLSHNSLGGKGVKIVSQADWPMISNIDLSFNKLGISAVKAIVGANWKKLKTLNLGNNSIGEGGCKQLCKNNWEHLRQLHLKDNNLYASCLRWLGHFPRNELEYHSIDILDMNCLQLKQFSHCQWRLLNKLEISKVEHGTNYNSCLAQLQKQFHHRNINIKKLT